LEGRVAFSPSPPSNVRRSLFVVVVGCGFPKLFEKMSKTTEEKLTVIFLF
jgi:hypothetical protein